MGFDDDEEDTVVRCVGEVLLVAGVAERSKPSMSLSISRRSLLCSLDAALSNSSSLTLSKPSAVSDEPIRSFTSMGDECCS